VISGLRYRRVAGTNPPRYELIKDLPFAPQVEFPGRWLAINNPANEYTNYTCLNRDCRMARVYREGSALEEVR
jgi:hypothetical protein